MFPARLPLAAALAAALAAPAAFAAAPAFHQLHGEGPPAAAEAPTPHGRRNKNGMIAEVFKFYAAVDAKAGDAEISQFLAPDVHSLVKFANRESHGIESFLESYHGVNEQYPLVDRTLDQFEVEPLEGDQVRIRFRLTSEIFKPSGRTRLVFRAQMRFDYRVAADGKMQIVEYIARPSLSTVPKTLWAWVTNFF